MSRSFAPSLSSRPISCAFRPRSAGPSPFLRPFTSSTARRRDNDSVDELVKGLDKGQRAPEREEAVAEKVETAAAEKQASGNTLGDLLVKFDRGERPSAPQSGSALNENALNSIFSSFGQDPSTPRVTLAERQLKETWHLHVYATKHNTHLTLTTPERNPKISLSTGNMGFRKANRGTYEAAFQLTSYVLKLMVEKGLMAEIRYVEMVMRGFGVGREAVGKAITGTEGRMIVPKVIRVSDATRLKFGGTRSPKPRRLG